MLYVGNFGEIHWYEVRQLRQELALNSDQNCGLELGCGPLFPPVHHQSLLSRHCVILLISSPHSIVVVRSPVQTVGLNDTSSLVFLGVDI